MKPDLESLYSQLDLQPNCSLEEFQRAYRRRIGELHPDRNPAEPQSAETRSQLRHLIWMYATVNRFHRRYGRMPGARSHDSHIPAAHWRMDTPTAYPNDDGDERHGRSTLILMVLFIALLILGAYWNWLASGPKASAYAPLPAASPIATRSALRGVPVAVASAINVVSARRA